VTAAAAISLTGGDGYGDGGGGFLDGGDGSGDGGSASGDGGDGCGDSDGHFKKFKFLGNVNISLNASGRC